MDVCLNQLSNSFCGVRYRKVKELWHWCLDGEKMGDYNKLLDCIWSFMAACGLRDCI